LITTHQLLQQAVNGENVVHAHGQLGGVEQPGELGTAQELLIYFHYDLALK
jgi:hypothetical protein